MPAAKSSNTSAIKSYLYQKPKPAESIEQNTKQPVSESVATEKKAENDSKPVESEPVQTSIPKAEASAQPEPLSLSNKQVFANDKSKNMTFNPYKALKNLSEQQNQSMLDDVSKKIFGKKSFSIMDGDPDLVPQRPLNKKPTWEERTSTASAFNSITKNDDGTCTLNQDLSHMGAGEWKAKQSFSCGESKFDRSFREHMEKVVEKVKPKN